MGWQKSPTPSDLEFEDCQYTACAKKCKANAKYRSDQGFEMFYDRAKRSKARNLLVFSHYPTDYFTSAPEFIAALSNNSKHNIMYFGGHRHNVDKTSTTSAAPNENWLVGGGGGWSCDGGAQGFLVGEISADYELTTYPVLVDKQMCCR